MRLTHLIITVVINPIEIHGVFHFWLVILSPLPLPLLCFFFWCRDNVCSIVSPLNYSSRYILRYFFLTLYSLVNKSTIVKNSVLVIVNGWLYFYYPFNDMNMCLEISILLLLKFGGHVIFYNNSWVILINTFFFTSECHQTINITI